MAAKANMKTVIGLEYNCSEFLPPKMSYLSREGEKDITHHLEKFTTRSVHKAWAEAYNAILIMKQCLIPRV